MDTIMRQGPLASKSMDPHPGKSGGVRNRMPGGISLGGFALLCW
jgi:hypothetical protein